MNQMDENYWKQLAQDWIRKQTQSSQVIVTNETVKIIPEAPSFSDNKNYDNMAVADMEIEDVKEEQSTVQNHLWNNVNQNTESLLPFLNIQKQQFIHVPGQLEFPTISNPLQKHHEPPRKNFTADKPIVIPNIPDPPSLKTFEDQINTVDMDMDDSDNGDNDSNSNSNSGSSMMEIQKRKKLPIWIREGLERMKREKELEDARLLEEQKRKEDEENRKKLMEEALKEIEREKKVSKSKYESSDSENEETEKAPQIKRKIEPIENDEEAYEKMMLLVRKTVTSLLLEVTDEKIQEISNETLSKYRKKASATTKPALIGLGLGVYSSSTDEEDSGDENGGNNSDWEPESVIKERIYQKQLSFEKRFKERMEKQTEVEVEKFQRRPSSSKSEPEQLKYVRSKHSDSDDDRQKFNSKNTRKDGEEKYETMIYSISTSSGPIARLPREKKTRFSDPKDGRSTTHMTHVGVLDSSKSSDNVAPKQIVIPPPPPIVESAKASESPKKEKKDKKKRRSSSTSSSSSDSGHRKKHKKHKKSSKHSKKSSKKREKSRSRSKSRDKRHHSSRSDRRSIESKSSIRSSESSRRRSRSRSRSREHRRRY